MATIELLSEETIDKIAAGEVVERPASIVKELVENAIDANATSVTVEIKDGGISFIRVTDNGNGIPRDQVKKAFYRHATSKLRTVEDLDTLLSLGFRGEALSSIAAIAQVEIMTKTKDELVGTRYVIEGAVAKEFSEIGIPNGTTIIVKNIFFNTPVRRKFLKTSNTEAGYITEICEHLAMSVPNVAFKFVNGGQLKFNTSGDGDLKEVIYRIYGKDIAKELIPVSRETKDISINGYLGKPVLNRSNRNFEKYFVNGRFVKSNTIAAAAEAGYKEYLMQHKFPFFVLDIKVNTTALDVNVHPTKMEIRFNNESFVGDFVETTIAGALKVNEMIPEALLVNEPAAKTPVLRAKGPEPYEMGRSAIIAEVLAGGVMKESDGDDALVPDNTFSDSSLGETFEIDFEGDKPAITTEENSSPLQAAIKKSLANRVLGNTVAEDIGYSSKSSNNVIKASQAIVATNPIQMDLFETKIISQDAMADYEIIGQIFDTYWLISYQDKLLILDQHAAHEKVKYEAILKGLKDKEVNKQPLIPPIIITLSANERNTLDKYKEYFDELGYEFDDFGGGEIAIRTVPYDLYGLEEKQVFLEVLDELADIGKSANVPEVFSSHIATMACKAAVKGNNSMTKEELWDLLCQLLTLENPYNCPHGRPTIVTMSKYELEKKFKRIV